MDKQKLQSIAKIIKVHTISTLIAKTNLGDLTYQDSTTGHEGFMLDAVPLTKEQNDRLLELLK